MFFFLTRWRKFRESLDDTASLPVVDSSLLLSFFLLDVSRLYLKYFTTPFPETVFKLVFKSRTRFFPRSLPADRSKKPTKKTRYFFSLSFDCMQKMCTNFSINNRWISCKKSGFFQLWRDEPMLEIPGDGGGGFDGGKMASGGGFYAPVGHSIVEIVKFSRSIRRRRRSTIAFHSAIQAME